MLGIGEQLKIFSLFSGKFRDAGKALGVFTETAEYEKGFAEHYNTHIKQHVDAFEQKRLEALEVAAKRLKICSVLSIPVILFAIILFSVIDDGESRIKLPGFLLFAAFSAMYYWVYKSINKYRKSIKSDIFPNIMSFMGSYEYKPTIPDRMYTLDESGIVPSYDREHSEDAIKGVYNGVDIDLFETDLEQERRSKNSTYYVSVFKGIVISLSMHKQFKGKTVVRKDYGSVGNWFRDKFSKMDNVQLEDPKFEKMFEVYSADQVEARYLLTTAFMERLLELSECFGSKTMECSFYNDYGKATLLMMIPVKKNLFEPGSPFEPEDFVDDAKGLLKEMHLIFKIIDILKLEQNIGM